MFDIDKNQSTINKKDTKDDQLDRLLWFKIISSISFGLLFGIMNLTGFFMFVL